MRKLMFAAALLAAATPLAAQDADNAVAGGGTLPAGWNARLDRPDAGLANVRFTPMGGGFHVTLGPAVLFWNAANAASGEYRATATFHQIRNPTHPEAYGLVIAGKDLGGQADYMYFLVRGDGKYMVRHRAANGDLHTIAPWTESAAVVKANDQGQSRNTVTAEAGAFGVRFLVNGTRVAEYLKADVSYLNTDGIVGLRVNHNLEVHIADFAVTKP